MRKMILDLIIDWKKNKKHKAIEKYGLKHAKVKKLSQQLNHYILEKEKILNKKII